MGDFVGLEGGSPSSASSGVPATPAPGRSTLTSRLAPPRDRAPRPETEAAAAGPAAVGAPGADAFGVHLLQGGAALASGVADQMSRGFGRDLSGVRVHTDGAAGAAAASLDAAAF